ncbi:unnamed protein product [Leuciscus chuanchicus]
MSEKQPRKEGKGGKKKDKDSSSPEAEPKLKDLRSVTVQDGKKTVFKCQIVAGNPVPSLKWYKNGQELTGKNKPKSIKIKERKKGKISELLIRKSTEGDAGIYTCEAVNNLGKTNTTASLTISKSIRTATTGQSVNVNYCKRPDIDALQTWFSMNAVLSGNVRPPATIRHFLVDFHQIHQSFSFDPFQGNCVSPLH